MKSNEQAGGFTLIELALVTVTVGILALAALPRFQHTAERLSAERSAFQVAQLLRYAHTIAVSQGRETVFAWDPDARTARVLVLEFDPSGNATITQVEEHLAPRSLEAKEARLHIEPGNNALGCPLQQTSLGEECLHLFPDGTSEPATAALTLGAHAYAITIDEATSHVSVRTPAR